MKTVLQVAIELLMERQSLRDRLTRAETERDTARRKCATLSRDLRRHRAAMREIHNTVSANHSRERWARILHTTSAVLGWQYDPDFVRPELLSAILPHGEVSDETRQE